VWFVLAGYTARVRIVWIYGFEARMAVVLCGVLNNGVGRVLSLDYRKLGMQIPVRVELLYVGGSISFRPDIQRPRQMQNALTDI